MNQILQSFGINVDWGFSLAIASLILIRWAMVTSVLPFLVGKPVPGIIRMGFAVVMTIYLYPFLVPSDPSLFPAAPLARLMLFVKEAFYGFAIGFAGAIIFHGFEAAGAVIDNQRGAAQAALLIPQLGHQTSLFGTMNFQLGIVLFLAIDGHLLFLRSAIESYSLLPLLEWPSGGINLLAVSGEFIRSTGGVLLISMQLTAPILIAILVSDVIMGIMSKAAPSINVYELGFAIRGILGVLIYFFALPLVAVQMMKLSLGMVDSVDKILRFISIHGGG